jgi:hypothetical protein
MPVNSPFVFLLTSMTPVFAFSCQTKTAEGQAIRRCIFFINRDFPGMNAESAQKSR